MPAAAGPCRSALGDPSAPVSEFSDGSPPRRRSGPSAPRSANAGPRAAQMCALSRAGRSRKTRRTALGCEVLCRMANAGFGMMCAHHWSGPNPHPGPGLPTRLPGTPTVNMPYRHPQTQTNRPHGHRGRAWAFASSAGLRHLYQWCAGKSCRQLDPDHGSGLPTVRSPRCAHRTAGYDSRLRSRKRGVLLRRGQGHRSCSGTSRASRRGHTAWAIAHLRSPLALSPDAWTAQYPTATMPSVPTVCHATGLPDRNSTPVPPHPKEASS